MSKSRAKTYQVEKIVGYREEQGKVQYLVHWTGYSTAHDSWEPENNLENCKDLIQAYMDEKAAKTRRRTRKPPVPETSAVLLSSNDEMGESPKKAKRGRPRKTQRASATPTPVTTVSATVTSSPAKGILNRSYDLRSTTRRPANEITFSSDEEEPTPKKRGPVKPRMTLSESKFRKQLTDTRKAASVRKVSTPNKNPPTAATTDGPPVKTRLQFDTEKHIGVQTRAMALKQQKEQDESFIAEAPDSEENGSTKDASTTPTETYPAWPEVGWKEFALAALVTATAAVGYICYTTDLCKYC